MNMNRREFLKTTSVLAAGGLVPGVSLGADEESGARYPMGKAEACIFLWLGGGAAHIDTFDPKRRGDGKKQAGSYYDAIDSAIPGAKMCAPLARTAKILDRCVPVRTLTHDIVNEHGAATNLVHTGRKPSETIVYPSMASIISHQRGPRDQQVPAYVVMGYHNIARDPGFLGPQFGYVYLTQIETGPNGFVLPPDVSPERLSRRNQLLRGWEKERSRLRPEDPVLRRQGEITQGALKMAGSTFMKAFDLKGESPSLREGYGGEFGQRCLLARRLVESGVRFVEVSFNLNFLNGTGWDTHNEGQLRQHLLIEDLDRAFSHLVLDLEQRGLLDTTLIVIATEFGRPAAFDSGGGRGHHSECFSGILAGGGLRTGQVVGVSDDLGEKILEELVSLPDFHATVYCAMGIRPSLKLFDGDRPVPITDRGEPIRRLFG